MKKLLSMVLCLCMVLSIFPATLVSEVQAGSSDANTFVAEPYKVLMGVNQVQPEVAFPVAGQMPTKPSFSNFACDMTGYKWEGTFNADGSFMEGQDYKLVMDFQIKANASAETRFIYQTGAIPAKSTVKNKNDYSLKAPIVIKSATDKTMTVETIFYADGTTLKLDDFGRAIPKGQESPTIGYTAIPQIDFKLDNPVAWVKPSKDATITGPGDIASKVEITDVIWNGPLWNSDRSFMEGTTYTVLIVAHIKSTDYKLYFDVAKTDPNLTGEACELMQVSADRQYAVFGAKFSPAKTQQYIDTQEKKKEEEATRKGTPVNKLEPGDSGSVLIKAKHFPSYTQPKEDNSVQAGSYTIENGKVFEIVEAYVPALNRKNKFFHAIQPYVSGVKMQIEYIPAEYEGATMTEYYKTGSNPKRPYYEMWKSQMTDGDPITKIDTWKLEFPDGKPHYSFFGSYDEKYTKEFYVEKVEYEHPDGVKPFMHTSAVVTFKATEDYFFDKNIKLNEYLEGAEHTTGFKRIDNKTLEVYLTAYTGDLGQDAGATDAMIAFKKEMDQRMLLPIATAELNYPLFEHWDLKNKRNDYEFNAHYVQKFLDRNMRKLYDYPTPDSHVLVANERGVKELAGNITTLPSNYTLGTYEIADDDLSDDIPGLVGEWCLLTNGKYIPKGCLKNIRYETMYKGAPAEFVVSPFKFAGGSGTMADPYLIETAEQLNAVRQGPRYHYKLIADIDLSGWGNWVPIGGTPGYGHMGHGDWNKVHQYSCAFLGSFDGNGHVVSGMKIVVNEETPFMTESGNYRAYGLFANLATNPDAYKIKNLGVVNFTIDVTYTSVTKALDIYAAAICGGRNNGMDIYNCYSKGGKINFNVSATAGSDPYINIHIGGISSTGGSEFVGTDTRKTFVHIEKCFNDSDISVQISSPTHNIYAGGIVGTMGVTHIHECYNSGDITLPIGSETAPNGSWSDGIAAGIAAYASISEIPGIYHFPTSGASFIQNCYNTGHITGRSANGIFGVSLSDIHLENCYSVGKLTGNAADTRNGVSSENTILAPYAAVVPYGTEYIRNCSGNGNAMSGGAWKSSSLGRKVLTSIPEDNQPSTAYNFKPSYIGNFTDVLNTAWYATPVRWAVQAHITAGTSDTTFSPDLTCTKAQILTFMWRADGAPKMWGDNPFTDVQPTDYYYNAALWAHENGIISGTTFNGNEPCTRADTVMYLWRRDGAPKADKYKGNFTDVAASDEFATAVAWALRYGITSGTSDTTFSPEMTCTRGQIVTFLRRAY